MSGTQFVLGIPVAPDLLEQWKSWYCLERQPFRLAGLPERWRAALPEPARAEVSPEVRDTFFMYGGEWVWLGEQDLAALEPDQRGWLLAERRRRIVPKPAPVWPSHPGVAAHLVRWVETGCRTSLHGLAAEALDRAAPILPRAADLAGTFPDASGANCFATVLAATGQDTADAQVDGDTFARWLGRNTEPLPTGPARSSDDRAGTVLVWHEQGVLAHAAVTVGEGWALHKPSQAWCSPRVVVRADELIRSWVYPGARLSRHSLR